MTVLHFGGRPARPHRFAMLATSALVGVAALPQYGTAQTADDMEILIAHELTNRSERATYTGIDLELLRGPGFLALEPHLLAIGVDTKGGTDSITLNGANTILADLNERRDYGLLPVPIGDLLDALAPFRTYSTAYGIDAGRGSKLLVNTGALDVTANAAATQFDMTVPLGQSYFDPVDLAGDVKAKADGMRAGTISGRATNSGTMTVISDATASRADIAFSTVGIDASTSLMTAQAQTRGLTGEGQRVRLTNVEGGLIDARATADSSAVGVTLQLIGVVGGDNAVQSSAYADGIAGQGGFDVLSNAGTIKATAVSDQTSDTIAVTFKELSPPAGEDDAAAATASSLAVATGMSGGAMSDSLSNTGEVELSADARQRTLGISINDGGISGQAIMLLVDPPVEDEADITGGAVAEIAGLRGDARGAERGYSDTLVNDGSVTGLANGHATSTSINIAMPIGQLVGSATGSNAINISRVVLDILGLGLLDYSADGVAFADGARGDGGNDAMRNRGTIDIDSMARSSTVGVSVAALDIIPDDGGPDEPLSLNGTMFNSGSHALARTTGLSGGDGNDLLINTPSGAGMSGDIIVLADAGAEGTEVSASLAIEDKALQLDSSIIRSNLAAQATATGMDGGIGTDRLENDGKIDADAIAVSTTTDVGLSVQVINVGGGINAPFVDKNVKADALSVGMHTAPEGASISHSGTITSDAAASTLAVGVGVEVTVNSASGLAATGGLTSSRQDSVAAAYGVDASALDDEDVTDNEQAPLYSGTGDIDVKATAEASRTTVDVSASYAATGAALNAPLSDTTNAARADAFALHGVHTGPDFEITSGLTAEGTSTARSAGVTAGLSGASTGLAAGVTAVRSDSAAEGNAGVLRLGGLGDSVTNKALLTATANGDARATTVNATIDVAMTGVGLGATLMDTATTGLSRAVTADTGAGADTLMNEGTLKANGNSTAISNGVGVAVAGSSTGVGIGAALSTASLRADSTAIAADMGADKDFLGGAGDFDAAATASASANGVDVGLTGSATGVAVGGALVDAATTAIAESSGATLGSGDDDAVLAGEVKSTATATSATVGVAVGLGFSGAGLTGGVAGVLADNSSHSIAVGVDGGVGRDDVAIAGKVESTSSATTTATSVAVTLTASAQGVALGTTVVDLDNTAASLAVGMAGDTEGLEDRQGVPTDADDEDSEDDAMALASGGEIVVDADADVTALSVAVNAQIAYVPLSAAIANSETSSTATGIGMFGGSGADVLESAGTITVTADSDTGGPAVNIAPFGGNVANFANTSTANSTGMAGGAGDDDVVNNGVINVTSTADANGELVAVTLVGGAVGDLSISTNANAIGLAGGVGNDTLASYGNVTTLANATAPTTSVIVDLVGAAFGGASTTSNATAIGLDGGAGDDGLTTRGTVGASAISNINATSVSVNFIGASDADASTKAYSTAAGVVGGGGHNSLDLGGTTTSSATSTARSTGVSVSLLGAALGSADVTADARSYGYLGGDGVDSGQIGGTVNATATGTARGAEVGVTLAGGAELDTSPTADVTATLGFGDAGADDLTFTGTGTATSTSTVFSNATSVGIVGGAGSTVAPISTANAYGLDGGADDDTLTNAGNISAGATSTVSAGTVNVEVAGASFGRISPQARATSIGIKGGEGADNARNDFTIAATSNSTASASRVDVVLVGATTGKSADSGILSEARSYGMRGDGGNDTLVHANTLSSVATAKTTGSSTSVVLAGAGLIDARSTVSATATGIAGDADNDSVSSLADLFATATATGTGSSYNVTLVGVGDSDVSANVLATSLGLGGGAGNDTLENRATITSKATATGTTYGLAVTLAGAELGDGSSKTAASAQGMDGGTGNDTLTNYALINADARSTGKVGRTSINIIGVAIGDTRTDGLATGFGLRGGEGADTLINFSRIELDTVAGNSASSTNFTIAGVATVKGGLTSTASGTGIAGGTGTSDDEEDTDEDNDIITNVGAVVVKGTSTMSSSNSSISILGVAARKGVLSAVSDMYGITSGGGDDIINSVVGGQITVSSTSTTTSGGNSSVSIIGAATSGGAFGSVATATGVSGDAGNDRITVLQGLSVTSTANTTFGSTSFSAIGYAGSGGAASSQSTAKGLFGGSGNDAITHGGTGTVTGVATLTLNSAVAVSFGAASSSRAPAAANVISTGLDGEAGDDTVLNAGSLTVNALATVSTSGTKFAFAGGASGTEASRARAIAYGMLGRDDNDLLVNSDSLFGNAEAKSTGSGAAGATFGSTNSASEAVTRTSTYMMHAGPGTDEIRNFGTVTGTTTNSSRSANTVTNATLFSGGVARSRGISYAAGALFYDTSGDTIVVNDGVARFIVYGDRGSFRGITRADATSDGVSTGIRVNANANAATDAYVAIDGVRLGEGQQMVVNNGTIDIANRAFSSAASTARGTALISGFATSTSRADNNDSVMTGIRSQGGFTSVLNTGLIKVNNSPKSASYAYARGAGLDITQDPDGTATTTSVVNNMRSYGVLVGIHGSTIENSGTIDVDTSPVADRALAQATYSGGPSLGVDAFAYAYAYADDNYGYGIVAEGGDNMIVNSGVLDIDTVPFAKARAEATGRGPDGDATATVRAYARNARAYGIFSGNGNDTIINTGTIDVRAAPSVNASRSRTVGEFCVGLCARGETGGSIASSATSTTYGILTSGGDDIVDQAGILKMDSSSRYAIHTGAGNDTLLHSGTTIGQVTLSSGDDTLYFNGGSISGRVDGGSGTDSLFLAAGGSLNLVSGSFENLTKTGGASNNLGLVSLSGTTRIEAGQIRLSLGSRLVGSHQYQVVVQPGTAHGQLFSEAISSIVPFTIGGSIIVEAAPGAYVDGRTYDVVAAAQIGGGFSSATLPEATALRSFSIRQDRNSVDVRVSVNPAAEIMASSSGPAASFAAALDGATPTATGEVERTIAVLQELPTRGDVAGAVEALTPGLPTTSLATTGVVLNQSVAATQQRAMAFRAALTGGRAATPVRLGYAQADIVRSANGNAAATVWSAHFDGRALSGGPAQALPTTSGGVASGLDIRAGEKAMLGFSIADLQTQAFNAGSDGAGAAHSTTASLYGVTGIGQAGYASMIVSWGQSRFEGNRTIVSTSQARSGELDVNSDMLSLRAEAGARLDALSFAGTAPELYGRMDYRSIATDRHAELGGEGLALAGVKGRSEDVTTRLGVRLTRTYAMAGLSLSPNIDIAWLHRFNPQVDSVTAHFADMPDYKFTLNGRRYAEDALEATAGLDLLSHNGLRLSVTGTGELGTQRSNVSSQIRLMFGL